MSDGMTDRRGQPKHQDDKVSEANSHIGKLTAENLQLQLALATERVNRCAMEGQLIQRNYNAAVADLNRVRSIMGLDNEQQG